MNVHADQIFEIEAIKRYSAKNQTDISFSKGQHFFVLSTNKTNQTYFVSTKYSTPFSRNAITGTVPINKFIVVHKPDPIPSRAKPDKYQNFTKKSAKIQYNFQLKSANCILASSFNSKAVSPVLSPTHRSAGTFHERRVSSKSFLAHFSNISLSQQKINYSRRTSLSKQHHKDSNDIPVFAAVEPLPPVPTSNDTRIARNSFLHPTNTPLIDKIFKVTIVGIIFEASIYKLLISLSSGKKYYVYKTFEDFEMMREKLLIEFSHFKEEIPTLPEKIDSGSIQETKSQAIELSVFIKKVIKLCDLLLGNRVLKELFPRQIFSQSDFITKNENTSNSNSERLFLDHRQVQD
ncbi:hypothetical protein HDU92_001616 [Lobulomyces angularis]|nr:hypothetical protein HDU92_001616 [Lobulomyces angularis]